MGNESCRLLFSSVVNFCFHPRLILSCLLTILTVILTTKLLLSQNPALLLFFLVGPLCRQLMSFVRIALNIDLFFSSALPAVLYTNPSHAL